ncbi:cytochrome P450 family protein sad [Xylocopa sonorina]|uniref:cytochrome P450 family protein sad n=1 Tax=Xylocopa sonorina TaxID=1818115 RepID=UPI00403B1BBB
MKLNVARNTLRGGKSLSVCNGVIVLQYHVPGCNYAGASRASRIDDPTDISKPADGACRSKIEIAEKSRDRNYGTAAATVAAEAISQEAPEPRGLPIFGTLFSFILAGGPKRQHEYVDRRHKELGPVYRERLGPVTAVFVNSPHEFRRIFRLEGSAPKHFLPEAWTLYNEIRKCRRGLLFMNGEEWIHFRKILNKVMLIPDPTSLMAGPCQEVAEGLSAKWREQIKNNAVIENLQIQLYQWSIEAMVATLMGSWHFCNGQLTRDFEILAKMLHKIFEHSATLSIIPAKLAMNLRLPVWRKFVTSVDTAFEIVRVLVPEMIKLGGDGLLKRMKQEGIRDEDVICIVTDFILAAGDTTATTLQWILLLLCNHPERQQELFEHVKVLSQKELLRSSLLRGIIKESLRLYPIAPFISRYLPEDSVIGNYFVPKGELLVLSLYSSGRNTANFSQPNEFLPERWIRTEKGTYQGVVHPHASLPFALGARSCIGRKLAEIQVSLALAELVKSFKIECINKDQVKLILHLISVPSDSMKLKLTRRN